MKIGIETIYDGYNYGCFLQAYAMQTFLESQGHDVVIYDHSTLSDRIRHRYFAKSLGRTLLKLKRYKIFSGSWKQLNIVRFKDSPQADLTIVGSDEVWNISNQSFEHRPQFYGNDCKGKRVVAYGPSLGYSSYDSYSKYKYLTDAIIANFCNYCVRDSFTENFLDRLGVKDIKRVCDPTILIYNQWKDLVLDTGDVEDYILYYSYNSSPYIKDELVKYAKTHSLKIIVAGFDYQWCDEKAIVNPFKFLELVSKAKFVVTSTFHGLIFSLIFNKQFIVFSANAKVKDLLKYYGVEKRIVSSDNPYDIDTILTERIDYESINRIMESDRESSIRILEQLVRY